MVALSGAFAISAHAQSSVTLYGLIDAGLIYTNNQGGHSNWQEVSSSTQNTVFGLKGTEDLGGGLHAVFKLEQGFLLNNGAQAFSGTITAPPVAYLFITASTGGSFEDTIISNVSATVSLPTN